MRGIVCIRLLWLGTLSSPRPGGQGCPANHTVAQDRHLGRRRALRRCPSQPNAGSTDAQLFRWFNGSPQCYSLFFSHLFPLFLKVGIYWQNHHLVSMVNRGDISISVSNESSDRSLKSAPIPRPACVFLLILQWHRASSSQPIRLCRLRRVPCPAQRSLRSELLIH